MAAVQITAFSGFADDDGSTGNLALANPSGPWAVSTDAAHLYTILIQHGSGVLVAYHSTNTGSSWAEIDSANRPAIHNGTTTAGTAIMHCKDSWMESDVIYTAYAGTDTKLRVIQFDMAAGTWGGSSTAGPTVDWQPDKGFGFHCKIQKQNTRLLVAYTAPQETISGTSYYRLGIDQFVSSTFSNVTTIGSGTASDALLWSSVRGDSNRVHVFYNLTNNFVSAWSLNQVAINSAGTAAPAQTITTSTDDVLIAFPGVFISTNTTLVVPYQDFFNGNLRVLEGTDADSPTWTDTDLSGLSTNFQFPEGYEQSLTMATLDTNNVPWIFFADFNNDPFTGGLGIIEFDRTGGTWNCNNASVYNAASTEGDLSVSAVAFADGTHFGLAFNRGLNGNNASETMFLYWPPVAAAGGQIIWGPLNITY